MPSCQAAFLICTSAAGLLAGKLVNQIKGRHADRSDGNAHRQVSPLPSPESGPHVPREDRPHSSPPDWHYRGLLPQEPARSLVGPGGMYPNGGRLSRPPRQNHPPPSGLGTSAAETPPDTGEMSWALPSSSNPPSPEGNDRTSRQTRCVHAKLCWVTIPKQKNVNWQGSLSRASVKIPPRHPTASQRCSARPRALGGSHCLLGRSRSPGLPRAPFYRWQSRGNRTKLQSKRQPSQEQNPEIFRFKMPALTILAKKESPPPLTALTSHPAEPLPSSLQGREWGELGEGRGASTAGQDSPVH